MTRLLVFGLLLVSLATPARADSGPDEDPSEDASTTAIWSATLIGQFKSMPPPVNNDAVVGWFDQYEFTPNKSSSVPFELGIRAGQFDLLRADGTTIFLSRLSSPTSNLGVSGPQVDQPFFNQRIDALTRLGGIDVDLFYRRMRTEQLRAFPNTDGPGLVFQDLTNPGDRFYRDRTGFLGELRARPYDAFLPKGALGRWWAPELSVRGGYSGRGGTNQLRIHRNPSNDWLGLGQEIERSVSAVGGGLLVAPNGLLTVSLDFDYEQMRFESEAITDGDLGYPAPESSRTIGFVPNSDRSTGTLRFNSRLGERAVFEGGFQLSQLEQTPEFTANQSAAGLVHNSVRHYAANAALDVHFRDRISANGFFKFDQRDNEIQRDTPLFNDANGSQVDPFVRSWRRFQVGGELEAQVRGPNRVAVGVQYVDSSRELEFAQFGSPRILPPNAQLGPTTRFVTLYGRTASRLWRRVRLDGELGFRWAAATGYAMDPDDSIYGRVRASTVLQFSRPVTLSAYVRGGAGSNDDFTLISGQGPVPTGTLLPRTYESSNVAAGLTTSVSPVDRLDLYASFLIGYDDRSTSLDISTLPRYWQDTVPIDFTTEGLSQFENQQISFILGGHVQLTERTAGGLSYALTSVQSLYAQSGSSVLQQRIVDSRIIDSNTHVLDFELGHWLREGLRVLVGYRFQYYGDAAPLAESIASVVAPFDRTTDQHTVTLGVTLNSEFFARSR